MKLGIERPTKKAGKDGPGIQRADIISRVWQAVAYLEEVRADAREQLRASTSSKAATSEVAAAAEHLVKAAQLLVLDMVAPIQLLHERP